MSSSYQHRPPSSASAGAGAGAGATSDVTNMASTSPGRQQTTTAASSSSYHPVHSYGSSSLVSPSAQNISMAHPQAQFPGAGLQSLNQAVNPIPIDGSPPNSGPSRFGVSPTSSVGVGIGVGQNHHSPDGVPTIANGAPSVAPSASPAKPQTRLRRACDMCSQRKVKCDESTPCRPCSDLGVDCTFSRAQRRRGPPNKHAEAFRAAKRSRTDSDTMPPAQSAPEMPLANGGLGGEFIGNLDAETIAPFPVLELLIDDYYTYIHPLIPFPHQPTFRASFINREDKTNPEFLGLLASMMGCLVASFPRAARLSLKAQHGDRIYPRSVDFVDHCRAVVLASRGHRFMEKEQVSVSDAMTSYFIGLSAGYTMRWNMCRRFMAEALSFVRELGFHRAGRVSPTARALGISKFSVNEKGFVEEEMGKRVFWVLFLGIRSMSQLGASHSEVVLPPETPPEYYPEFPREVDDECITHDRILPQPDGIVSLMVGFNKAIEIYMTMQSLVGYELHYGLSSLEWNLQMNILDAALTSVKPLVDPENLAEDLRVQLIPGPATVASVWDHAPGFGYVAPAFPNPQPSHDIRLFWDREPGKKRLLQYEIQKTNIYTSWLATRSFYVERFLTLRDERRNAARQTAQQSQISIYRMPPDTSHIAAAAAAAIQDMEPERDAMLGMKFEAERELVVQDLMTVLMSIPQRNMEPNGASLINKIRQVASTLLNDVPARKGPVAQKNEAYLAGFLHILTRLEKSGPPGSAQGSDHNSDEPMTAEDEEAELRSWADLRDYQDAFIRSGGFARA